MKSGLVAATACVVAVAGYFGISEQRSSGAVAGSAAVSLPQMKADVAGGLPPGNRTELNLFSWLSFIALNSPVSADGEPLKDVQIGQTGDNATVWQSWMEDYQILLGDGEKPPAWGSTRTVPASCAQLPSEKPLQRVVRHASKAGAVVSQSTQAQAGPLIDQDGNYVRYEIVFNEVMYDYIVENQLYNLAGIAALEKISFPTGDPDTNSPGAIEIKAAWKVLGANDDASRFHVTEAYVFDELADSCSVDTLALVGLHISMKTQSAPQWIWSTFEHVDNAPDLGKEDARRHYTFYNPDCAITPGSCQVNQLPSLPWDPSKPNQTPVQVVRADPIAAETQKVNADFQALLRKINPQSVWANYALVGTQYPQKPDDPTDSHGRPFPQYLANTTIETYLQGRTPNVSSNCIACHSRATAGSSAKPADFTYLLSRVTAKD